MSNMPIVGIIGGGASGLFSAVNLLQHFSNNQINGKVIIFEQKDKVAKKLLATGNGQCNIGNSNIASEYYHSSELNLATKPLNAVNINQIVKFFRKLGIMIVTEPCGKMYPRSYQANSVVDMLRFHAQNLGAEIITDHKVTTIVKKNDGYIIDNKTYCNKVIMATGGITATKLGGSNSGIKLLETLGHSKTKLYPAIVQLKSDNPICKSLKGIKFIGIAKLYLNNKHIRSEYGEILFTDYGLSGPAILQLSGNATPYISDCKVTITLDLLPDIPYDELITILSSRRNDLSFLSIEDYLSGILNKRLGQQIIKLAGLNLHNIVCNITNNQISAIAKLAKELPMNIYGDMGMENGQVMSGGIKLSEVNMNTMESKINKSLYITGEILNIYGDCGGYNLNWAWTSAYIASKSIIESMEDL